MKSKPINELLNFSVINIDKPTGPTSFQISQFVKNSLNLKKTSHMGTLDPMVTGVLPITLGRACRLSPYLMHRDKSYVGIMRLHEELSKDKLEKEMNFFLGKITQLPPLRSRVKRAEREREIKSFKILEIRGKDVLFETEVQAGTYIRKLIHDLGEKIGGAHMTELRRTKAGLFDESTIENLYDFEKAVQSYKEGDELPLRKMIVPAEQALKQLLPSLKLKNIKAEKQLLTGKPLMKQDVDKLPDEDVFILLSQDKFIGVYHKHPEGDIIAKAGFVYTERSAVRFRID